MILSTLINGNGHFVMADSHGWCMKTHCSLLRPPPRRSSAKNRLKPGLPTSREREPGEPNSDPNIGGEFLLERVLEFGVAVGFEGGPVKG